MFLAAANKESSLCCLNMSWMGSSLQRVSWCGSLVAWVPLMPALPPRANVTLDPLSFPWLSIVQCHLVIPCIVLHLEVSWRSSVCETCWDVNPYHPLFFSNILLHDCVGVLCHIYSINVCFVLVTPVYRGWGHPQPLYSWRCICSILRLLCVAALDFWVFVSW